MKTFLAFCLLLCYGVFLRAQNPGDQFFSD